MNYIRPLIAVLFVLFSLTGHAILKPECKSIGNVKQCDFTLGDTKYYAFVNLPYALCSKALCSLDKDKSMATCECTVYGVPRFDGKESISVGPKPFSQAAPASQQNKLTEVVSNYSFANIDLKNKHHMHCSFPKPMMWANCYGVKCEVYYAGPKPYARCHCPVASSTDFVSSGPKSSKKCYKGDYQIWSAADIEAGKDNAAIMNTMYKMR